MVVVVFFFFVWFCLGVCCCCGEVVVFEFFFFFFFFFLVFPFVLRGGERDVSSPRASGSFLFVDLVLVFVCFVVLTRFQTSSTSKYHPPH